MNIELILVYLPAGLCGLILGSFYNVVIARYQTGISIIYPPSHCPHCKNPLQASDLVPLFSYIYLRGRCRYCRERISFRYTLVELLSTALFLASLWRFGLSPDLIRHLFTFSILLIISVIDLERQKIPNLFVALILAWALLWQLLHPAQSWTDAALGMLAGGGVALLIALLSRGGMGGGDIKLFAVAGFLAGWLDLILIFALAVFLGAFTGVILILLRKKNSKSALPFGPFIALSYFLTIFWAAEIWGFYFSLL